jgi:serine/threonine protein kinase
VDDSGKACIADFGLSKVYSPEKAGAKASKISGTLRFLAPEALKGQPLNYETDVYAFGMVIYEVGVITSHFHSPLSNMTSMSTGIHRRSSIHQGVRRLGQGRLSRTSPANIK